jgi:hypothetical protein
VADLPIDGVQQIDLCCAIVKRNRQALDGESELKGKRFVLGQNAEIRVACLRNGSASAHRQTLTDACVQGSPSFSMIGRNLLETRLFAPAMYPA